MPEVLEPLDINQAATEIAVTYSLLRDSTPDTTFVRWIEYRAYHELVCLLGNAKELPPNYEVYSPEARSLREWLNGEKALKPHFAEEARRLIEEIQGGGAFDSFCRFYCELKRDGALNKSTDIKQLIEHLAGILLAYTDILFFGGLPYTSLIAFLLRRVLDEVCKCSERPLGGYTSPVIDPLLA